MDLIRIPYSARFQHFYLPGGTGAGKSTQLLNFIVQDIYQGCGITVIDPKGDLVEPLLDYIPEHRKDDVFYISIDNPIPFDFLSYKGPTEKDELVEDILYLLLGDAGNAPRAKSILMDVLYTLFASDEPISFLDIARFLLDPDRHKTILRSVKDEELKAVWKKGVPSDDKLDPIMSRFKKYLRNSVLRTAFGTPNAPLNIAEVMNNRKILLVSLGGASRAAIDFGSLLFMKLKQEVFRRYQRKPSERIPHFVFIDEFDQFAHVEDFKKMITMARGYKVAMTLANPSYSDLPEDIQRGMGIIGSFICFRLDPHDLPFFRHKCGLPDPDVLTALPDRSAYYKILGQNGLIKSSPPPPRLPTQSFREHILSHCATIGRKRTVDTPSCNSTHISHDESDGNKEEEIAPSGRARIPVE